MANSSSVISDLPPPPGFLLDDLNSSKVVCNRQTSIRDTVTDFIDTVIERSSSLVEERRSGSLSNLAEEFAEKCYTDTPLKRHPYIVKDRNPFECVADIDENQFQPLTAEFFKKPLVESKRGSSPTSVSSYQTPQESPSSLEGNESSYHTCNTSAEIPSSSSELEQTLVEGNTLDANLTLQASSSSESLCNNNHSCESASMSDDESIPLPKPKIDYANLDFDSIEDPFGSSSKSMGFSPPKTSFLNETLSNKENLSSDPPKVKPVPPKRTVSKITKSAKPKPPVRKTFTSLSQPVSQQKGETLNGNEPKNLLQSGEVEMTKNKVSTENASNEDPFTSKNILSYSPPPPSPPPPMDDPFVTKSKMSYSPPPPSPPPPPMDIDPFASKSKMSYSPPPPSPPPPIHIDPFATKSKMSYSPPPNDVDPFATKSKMSYSPPPNDVDPFATKNKMSYSPAPSTPPPIDVDPFATKSKMSYSPPPPPIDVDPFATKSKMSYSPPPSDVDPFATKSKMSYSPAPSPPPPIDVDPFATKSKMSYSPPLNAADPFETKSKMSYSPPPNVVDPFATKSKMSYSPPPSDVDPFATKSKMSYSPPPSVNCTPQSNNVSQNFQNGENVVNESKDFVDEAISDESENTNSFSSRKSFSTNTYRKPKKKRSPKSSEKDDSNSSFCEINISDTSSTNVDAVNTEEEYFNPNGLEELSKRGNLTDLQSDLLRQSLFTTFDPLVKRKSSSSKRSNSSAKMSPVVELPTPIEPPLCNGTMPVPSAEVLYGNKKNVEKLHIDGNNVQQSSQFSTLNEDNQSLRIANQMLKEENATLAEDVEKLKVNLKLYAALIEQLKSQKENKIQEESQEKMKLIKEKEMAIEDIRSVERAFSEQHARYEKLKSVCESQQDECTSFRKYADEMKSLYEKELRRYEGLKEHANIKLNSANEEREKMKKQHDQEVTKLQTISKRLEMRNANLEQQIEQIKSENEELTQICDSLLAPSQAD